MNKKLLLILPPSKEGFWGKVHNGKAGLVRLSLPTIAALTPPDWDVVIHDARTDAVDYDLKVDLVGITAFTAEAPQAYMIADNFRKRGVPVVMGGIHVSALPEEALEHADAVVVREAEGIWELLLRDLEVGKLQKIYRAKKPCDMRDMKIPKRHLVKRDMYVSPNTIQATRGCPFDCDYCAVTGVFGRQFRIRPVKDVVDEIAAFDTQNYFFVDDNICGNPGYAKKLFRALLPLKKTWGGQTSITFARDEELLELYAKSGGRYAFIGFETISEKNLISVNKNWNQTNSYGEMIRKIHGAGINIVGSFIFGFDDDDVLAFQRTFEFIMENRIDAAQFHILTPFPGTRLFDSMKSERRILSMDWSKYTTSEVVFQPKKMTVDELQENYYRIYHQLNSVHNIMKRVFRSWRGIAYRLYINTSYRNKARRMPRKTNDPTYS